VEQNRFNVVEAICLFNWKSFGIWISDFWFGGLMVSKEDLKKALLYILSHHTEEHLDRTISLKIFGREIRLCARCTGLTLGFVTGLVLLYFSVIPNLGEYLSLILAIVLALPTMVDWWTQSVFGRESKNYIRLPTGYSMGFGITLLKFANLTWTLITIIIFFAFAAFGLYRRVIREYGPKSEKYVGKKSRDE
jgi:uncharacterized membrane protein